MPDKLVLGSSLPIIILALGLVIVVGFVGALLIQTNQNSQASKSSSYYITLNNPSTFASYDFSVTGSSCNFSAYVEFASYGNFSVYSQNGTLFLRAPETVLVSVNRSIPLGSYYLLTDETVLNEYRVVC